MDNPFQSPAVISFCPGILGLERGLERAIGKINVVAYVEIEAFIIANLLAGMEQGLVDPAPVWTDATTFDAEPFCGRIHGIIGGYPCPGESLAGLREGHLYKGFIWPAIRRAIAAARPLWCFFENVDDHLTGTYPIVQRSLRNMGYAVEAGIFSAEEIGATHERQRLFILAIADGYDPARLTGSLSQSGSKNEGATQGQNGQRVRDEHWNGGDKMEHPECILPGGLPGGAEQKITGFTSTSENVANAIRHDGAEVQAESRKPEQRQEPFSDGNTWGTFPAGQGQQQFDWEESRTIEPGLGSSVNGYNFREDFLRAIGNSVVEQTAELAFRTLLAKHLKL